MKQKYTCPCCGYKTLDEPIGSFDICPVCFWEADRVQSTDPDYEGGPNHVSLRQAQRNFMKFGACKEDMLQHVRSPTGKDVRDPEWEPLGAATNEEMHLKYSGLCAVCGRRLKPHDGVTGYITPLSEGGIDEPKNVQWICHRCNELKGNQRTNEQVRRLLSLPEDFKKILDMRAHEWKNESEVLRIKNNLEQVKAMMNEDAKNDNFQKRNYPIDVFESVRDKLKSKIPTETFKFTQMAYEMTKRLGNKSKASREDYQNLLSLIDFVLGSVTEK